MLAAWLSRARQGEGLRIRQKVGLDVPTTRSIEHRASIEGMLDHVEYCDSQRLGTGSGGDALDGQTRALP